MDLYQLKKNESFVIKRIKISGELGKRMAEMGINARTKGLVVRKSLFGGPVQIKILNYDLTLRKIEAMEIEVERVAV